MEFSEIIKYLLPVIILQIGFQIYAIYDLVAKKQRRTRNLNFIAWLAIIILGEIAGPAIYFIVGRSEE